MVNKILNIMPGIIASLLIGIVCWFVVALPILNSANMIKEAEIEDWDLCIDLAREEFCNQKNMEYKTKIINTGGLFSTVQTIHLCEGIKGEFKIHFNDLNITKCKSQIKVKQ